MMEARVRANHSRHGPSAKYRWSALAIDLLVATVAAFCALGVALDHVLSAGVLLVSYYLRYVLLGTVIIAELSPQIWPSLACLIEYPKSSLIGRILARVPIPLRSRSGGLFFTEITVLLIAFSAVIRLWWAYPVFGG